MQKRIVSGAVAATLAVFLGAVGIVSAQVQITECGQEVPHGQLAVLAGDLDCSQSAESSGLYLEPGVRLDLNGFTLTAPLGEKAIGCYGRCSVTGPGAIAGNMNHGIFAPNGSLRLSGVTITGGGNGCVYAEKLTVEGCTITACGDGVRARRKARMYESVVSDNAHYGIRAPSVSLRNVEVTGNGGDGVHAVSTRSGYIERGGTVRALDSVITGNGSECDELGGCFDIDGRRVRLRNTTYGTCSGCR